MADNNKTARIVLKKIGKTAHTYEPKVVAGQPPVVSSVYIPTWVFGPNPPQELEITVAPAN